MKVDTSYIQFFSTEVEGDGKPVDLEITQKDKSGRVIRGRIIHNVHCNLEFVEDKQVQIEYWNSEKKGVVVANSLDDIKINNETLEPYSNKQ